MGSTSVRRRARHRNAKRFKFFYGKNIPSSLRVLREGVQEMIIEGDGLHVFGGHTAAGPSVVVDHEGDYKEVETAVHS